MVVFSRKNLETQLNTTLKVNQEAKKNYEERQSMDKTMNSNKGEKEKCHNCAEQEKKIMDQRLKLQNMKT